MSSELTLNGPVDDEPGDEQSPQPDTVETPAECLPPPSPQCHFQNEPVGQLNVDGYPLGPPATRQMGIHRWHPQSSRGSRCCRDPCRLTRPHTFHHERNTEALISPSQREPIGTPYEGGEAPRSLHLVSASSMLAAASRRWREMELDEEQEPVVCPPRACRRANSSHSLDTAMRHCRSPTLRKDQNRPQTFCGTTIAVRSMAHEGTPGPKQTKCSSQRSEVRMPTGKTCTWKNHKPSKTKYVVVLQNSSSKHEDHKANKKTKPTTLHPTTRVSTWTAGLFSALLPG